MPVAERESPSPLPVSAPSARQERSSLNRQARHAVRREQSSQYESMLRFVCSQGDVSSLVCAIIGCWEIMENKTKSPRHQHEEQRTGTVARVRCNLGYAESNPMPNWAATRMPLPNWLTPASRTLSHIATRRNTQNG